MFNYLSEILLFALIVFNQIMHNIERKMLINRILARDFPELQEFETRAKPMVKDQSTVEL